MGGNPAKAGNAIAQASLNESKKQYDEQQAEKNRAKEAAKANAGAMRTAGNMAYSNQYAAMNDLGGSRQTFSLVSTSGGTTSVLNTLMGGNQSTTLGG